MALGATNAAADNGSGTFGIFPDVARAGDSLELTATCDHPDFTAPAAVESDVLVSDGLTGTQDENGVWQLTGTAKVPADAEGGTVTARFQCGPESVVADVLIDDHVVYAAIGVTDEIIKPGQEVQVTAGCHDDRFTGSKIESPVLTAPDFVRKKGDLMTHVYFSDGKIAEDAKPGTYPISFTCVDRKITNEFTVVAEDVKAEPQVPVKPVGAPETGSLDPAPADDSDGMLAPAMTLVAAGGAGLLALRRYRRS